MANDLLHTKDRIIVKVDLEYKNQHTFESGLTIRLERGYNNFNQREVAPANAIVVSADSIPSDAQVLIHHNSTHDSNKIFDYKPLSGEAVAERIEYFSIPEADCYAWIDSDGRPHPLKGFAFALRVFEPYTGMLNGIEPKLIKDVLYLTTGALSGIVVGTLKSSDYEIVYQSTQGREERIIRIRHSDEEEIEREEVIFIHHELTEKVNNGELFVGLTPSDSKPIKTTTTTNEVEINTTSREQKQPVSS